MSVNPAAKPTGILRVDGNRAEVCLSAEAPKEAMVRNELPFVPDGEEAMGFLHRRRKPGKVSPPNLVLLELSSLTKARRQVLAEIEADPGMRRIPGVVLTSSRAVEDFWFEIAALPRG